MYTGNVCTMTHFPFKVTLVIHNNIADFYVFHPVWTRQGQSNSVSLSSVDGFGWMSTNMCYSGYEVNNNYNNPFFVVDNITCEAWMLIQTPTENYTWSKAKDFCSYSPSPACPLCTSSLNCGSKSPVSKTMKMSLSSSWGTSPILKKTVQCLVPVHSPSPRPGETPRIMRPRLVDEPMSTRYSSTFVGRSSVKTCKGTPIVTTSRRGSGKARIAMIGLERRDAKNGAGVLVWFYEWPVCHVSFHTGPRFNRSPRAWYHFSRPLPYKSFTHSINHLDPLLSLISIIQTCLCLLMSCTSPFNHHTPVNVFRLLPI